MEIDDDGEATVVFGDGAFGQALPQDATVKATYRVGGGQIGNLGADTLRVIHPDSPMPWTLRDEPVTNPLPALEVAIWSPGTMRAASVHLFPNNP